MHIQTAAFAPLSWVFYANSELFRIFAFFGFCVASNNNTVEEYFSMVENKSPPENSSYSGVYTITFEDKNIDDVTKIFKEQIDYEYKQDSDVYFVVYVETCPNGHRTNPNPCWAVYFLY